MSTIRLWDRDFKLLATENDCPAPPAISSAIELHTSGPIREFIQQWINNTHPRADFYITIDAKTRDEFAAGVYRRGGLVTEISRHGDTTTISWADR